RHRRASTTAATATSGAGTASRACAGARGAAAGGPRRESGRRWTLRTTGVPHIARFILLDPENFPGVHIKGHNGVGAARVGLGKGIAGAYVDRVALGIDGSRTPEAASGRSPELLARGRFSFRGRLVDCIGFADLFAGSRVQRRHHAT